jgi:hypothetical protein
MQISSSKLNEKNKHRRSLTYCILHCRDPKILSTRSILLTAGTSLSVGISYLCKIRQTKIEPSCLLHLNFKYLMEHLHPHFSFSKFRATSSPSISTNFGSVGSGKKYRVPEISLYKNFCYLLRYTTSLRKAVMSSPEYESKLRKEAS